MNALNTLISVNNLRVRRGTQLVLQDITLQVEAGTCLAVVGPTGSGKTTFLQALAGQVLPVSPGMLSRRAKTEFVSFKEDSNRFSYSGYFYQQRYQATMADKPETEDDSYHAIPTLRHFLQHGESPENTELLRRLGLASLLDRSFIKLSNGQTRKARIGKALLRHPAVLLLDNPFVGLDKAFRTDLVNWLGDLIEHGLTLVLVTEANDVPTFVTDVLALQAGEANWLSARQDYVPANQIGSITALPVLQTNQPPTDFAEAFRLQNVTVQYADTVILKSINWTVRAGERWALLGQNGAGKSVLLSLLYGDHPQAYANDVNVFGHRRGKSGESIWDVKRRIGFVSPELHLYFPQQLSIRQVALTGLTDTLTPPRRITPETEADLQALLAYFDLTDTENRSFGTLSAGEQRLVLLVRALLKNPPVLLLDEPFQVLDAHHIELARQLIASLTDKTILFVTHDLRELPENIDRIFDLDALTSCL